MLFQIYQKFCILHKKSFLFFEGTTKTRDTIEKIQCMSIIFLQIGWMSPFKLFIFKNIKKMYREKKTGRIGTEIGSSLQLC